ncbi:MAG: hypothetical protein FJ387_19665 [Verrucomicrobia bacterium]|nr:hypothetical protein [Verrucomicrobiota bacterium]
MKTEQGDVRWGQRPVLLPLPARQAGSCWHGFAHPTSLVGRMLAILWLGWAVGDVNQLYAQRVTCPRVESTGDYSCKEVKTYWEDPVDLDGDGEPEFWHGSYQQLHSYGYSEVWFNVYVDNTEALFPAAHVQLYALPWPDPDPRFAPRMLLEPGQAIQVNPQPECSTCQSWAWDPPAAQIVRHALGMGQSSGIIYHSPCDEVVCSDSHSAGYLSPTTGPTNGWFGFRISRTDGWHLGWLRLANLSRAQPRPRGGYTVVLLTGYALHPDPDTEIAAGEEPRPRLRVELLAEQARLFWSTAFTGYSLEQTPRLDSPAWIPVPGVQANSVTLDLAEAKGFFRLRR